MKQVALLTLLLIGFAWLAGATLKQELVGADDLSVGDRFQLNIRADVALQSVVVPDTLSSFHVLETRRVGKRGQLSWLRMTLVPLLPGSHSFPRLRVELERPDGNEYYTERFRLNIIPVRGAQDTLLVDIKPVEKYPLQLPWWLYLLLLALVPLLVLGYFLAGRIRASEPQSASGDQMRVAEPPLPPWKLALVRLEELEAEQLLERGEIIHYHYRLSLIVREFLEARYRFAALEMTTSEIWLITQRIFVEKGVEVLRFLRYCDRVKFAKYQPGPDEVEVWRMWLRGWLQSFELAQMTRIIADKGGESAEVR